MSKTFAQATQVGERRSLVIEQTLHNTGCMSVELEPSTARSGAAGVAGWGATDLIERLGMGGSVAICVSGFGSGLVSGSGETY